ncbi:MAG TPA: protein translocase subunit SecF [Armatimonadota bacterium]|nr:protein translocase subunit SecF [Armatimonadota bacterium]
MQQALRTGGKHPFDIVATRWLWFTLSGLVGAVGLVFLFSRGLNLGLDYTGGGQVRFYTGEGKQLPPLGSPDRPKLAAAIRDAASKAVGGAVDCRLSGEDQIVLQFPARTNEELESRTARLRDSLNQAFGDQLGTVRGGDKDHPDRLDTTFIGPKIGGELRANAVKALILGSLLILGYLWLRFEFRFGVAALIAILHDAVILVGVFAIGYWQIDLAFIAAILTVLGYSVNDSVVIFDRIRENMGARRKSEDFATVVNDSLWQTMPRSINTTATTLYTLVFLFLVGGETIHTFSLALLVGIFSGAYSSVFNAAPIVVQWGIWSARRAERKAAKEREGAAARPVARQRRAPASATVASADASAAEGVDANGSPVSTPASAGNGGDAPTKARAQAAKQKRAGRPQKSKRRW